MNRNEMTNFSSRVIRHDLGWCCRKGPCSAKAVAVLGATCAPCCFGCSARCVLLKGCCCSLGAGFQGAVLGAVLGRVDPPASKERTTKYKTTLLNLWIMLVHFFSRIIQLRHCVGFSSCSYVCAFDGARTHPKQPSIPVVSYVGHKTPTKTTSPNNNNLGTTHPPKNKTVAAFLSNPGCIAGMNNLPDTNCISPAAGSFCMRPGFRYHQCFEIYGASGRPNATWTCPKNGIFPSGYSRWRWKMSCYQARLNDGWSAAGGLSSL